MPDCIAKILRFLDVIICRRSGFSAKHVHQHPRDGANEVEWNDGMITRVAILVAKHEPVMTLSPDPDFKIENLLLLARCEFTGAMMILTRLADAATASKHERAQELRDLVSAMHQVDMMIRPQCPDPVSDNRRGIGNYLLDASFVSLIP